MLHRRRRTGINHLKSLAAPNGQGRGFPRILHNCACGSSSRGTAVRIISPNPSYLRPRRPHAAAPGSHNLPKSFIVGGEQGFPRRSGAPAAAHRTGCALPQILHSCVRGDNFPHPSSSHNLPKSFIVTPVRRTGRQSYLLISMTYGRPSRQAPFPQILHSWRCPGSSVSFAAPLLQLFSRCSVVSAQSLPRRRPGGGAFRFPQILHSCGRFPARPPDLFLRVDFRID